MKLLSRIRVCVVLCGAALTSQAAGSALLGWNNLGMHCMDSDFSVFSILPPYNTIEAQLIVGGKLVTNGAGYTVTYEAIADPDGSLNSTSQGKGNFYQFTSQLYAPLSPDAGLAGWGMPGPNNVPQSMLFENLNHPAAGVSTPVNWFRAEGIPITPYDDAMHKNPYPLMRLVARDSANRILATNDVVLPVSDEMDCRACHASGAGEAAKPAAGWVFDPNPDRDYRLNILQLHDERRDPATWPGILSSTGFNPEGLYKGVVAQNQPVLCAKCHLSEALQGSGYGNIPPLTQSIHSRHATVIDPVLGITLGSSQNRAACYRCHPGSATKCLRGAMGAAVASDGSMEMQCQSCHGGMQQVGSASRVGWFMEPNCQSCHTGTATHNNGQIRYTSVFTDTAGTVRTAVDSTFATTPDTPAAGLSLFRFSKGHGGLQCEACHGSTHAEFPSSHRNDNLRNLELQGHIGVMSDCTACHTNSPSTVSGGPHGMHPVGQAWVSQHHDLVEGSGASQCQACHGLDYRGTVLSRALGPRTLNAFTTQTFFRGATIGCYTCHNGPSSESANTSPAPTVSDVSAGTITGQSVTFALPSSGANLTLRIISQPAHGSVGLSGSLATYYPDAGFSGTDTFTFAAYDGAKNSTLATGTIVVGSAPTVVAPAIVTQPKSETVAEGSTVTFTVVAAGTDPLNYQWRKDGLDISSANSATLTLASVTIASAGSYTVVVSNSAGSVTSDAATLTVTSPPVVPVITQQPISRTVSSGASISFSVTATGTAPLSYQWRRNGVDIPGANSATLTLASVTIANAGSYAVVVSNGAGSVTSDAATLTVASSPVAPVITRQPVSRTVQAGANTYFSVTAKGTAPLRYQWQKNGVDIPNATSSVLYLYEVTPAAAGKYSVKVSNVAGSVTSTAATLTVTSDWDDDYRATD